MVFDKKARLPFPFPTNMCAPTSTGRVNTNIPQNFLDKEFLVVNGIVGQGSCSDVYSVTRMTDERQFALKVYGPNHIGDYMKELHFLQKLRSTHVIGIEAEFCEIGKPSCILMELCEGGDLFERVMSGGRFSDSNAADFMVHLVESLKVLQAHRIVHLDLKPENIAFKRDCVCSPPVLIDFNLSRDFDEKPVNNNIIAGTYGYCAPEVLRNEYIGPAADIFSAGVTLYIILCASFPFTGWTNEETVGNTLSGASSYMHTPEFMALSTDAQDLLLRMMNVDQSSRITLDEILGHPWMQGAVAKSSKRAIAHISPPSLPPSSMMCRSSPSSAALLMV